MPFKTSHRLIVIVGLLAAAAVFGPLTKHRPIKPEPSPKEYCGPDGQLTTIPPPIQSHRSYCLRPWANTAHGRPGVAAPFGFSIIDDQGNTLRQFLTVHDRQMHVIVARKDLAEFQHLHPQYDSTSGRFTLPELKLPTDGEYRLFADFTPAGTPQAPDGMPLAVTSYVDLESGEQDRHAAQPLGPPERQATVGPYTVALGIPGTLHAGKESRMTFTVSRNGAPVTDLEPYLGALGHAVVLREGTLDFLHTHALTTDAAHQSGQVAFALHVPEPGRYKAFVQFQHEGEVITAAFVLPTVGGDPSQSAPSSPSGHH